MTTGRGEIQWQHNNNNNNNNTLRMSMSWLDFSAGRLSGRGKPVLDYCTELFLDDALQHGCKIKREI